MLKIKKEIYQEIVSHAVKDFPIEACGYLAEREGVICKRYHISNLDQSGEHFTMDPKEQFAVLKKATAEKLNLCAVYHSHPETPARPSEEDIRCAYDPAISYVIASLAEAKQSVKSFKIKDGQVEKEEIQIEG